MQLIQEFDRYPPIDRIFALVHEREDAVFLDSSMTNQLGKFSIIGLNPYLKLTKGEVFTVNGTVSEESYEAWVKNYLKSNQEENHTGLPLTSGAIGYFSYDYGRKKERVVSRHPREVDIPDSILVFYDSFIIENHPEHRLYLVANSHEQDAAAAMDEMKELLERAEKNPSTAASSAESASSALPVFTANFTKQDYMDAVQHMIQYIIEGDIYIANMTQQLRIASPVKPFEMFQRLRINNPSPFGGLFQLRF